ncbi:NADH-quinone oxidoreductase subunit NuoG [Paludibacterium yongneupense]|uniref:NADH-quinone oxidoreductase subunit NuoG n=1 Tax=Paludibacterium yongneupense TaxID=400061 RepID=UPI000418F6E0|nr:NADH-quinone oxidoreductase subunit NuoG [Paludibacterium yongneupense]
MLEIEIDGKKLTVPQGSTVMEAAHSAGTHIPHFCYHKKLSIAANCRMCLVEVEKAPKPLPACATPVTDGMKVHTHSPLAVQAQQGVMEFLLINHPLDCPICDQGGECQLQDIAVGYGGGASRYKEKKRAVVGKDMGPLVSAEEMSRCIHCTRCVRFTEEIGGYQEIGMAERGEGSEIMPFLGKTVDSEISGNVIDLCPVGALTSKPFRYSARGWELSRRKSVAPHDGLGSNLVVQVKDNRVLRVLPRDNEDINECWLSDRDRFSYEGLNAADRLQKPRIKFDGKWHETDWTTALDYVVKGLNGVAADHGRDAIGVLASPHATSEALYLLQKVARGFGVNNIDSRLRQSDFGADAARRGAYWLGASIVELAAAKSLLLVGSSIRQEHPLLAARLRQSVKKGAQLNVVHVVAEELRSPVNARLVFSPNELVDALEQVLAALAELKGEALASGLAAAVPGGEARRIAASLAEAESTAIALGNVAQHHPAYSRLLALAQEIARLTGGRFGVLSEAANSVGAQLAGALPTHGAFGAAVAAGLNGAQMLAAPRKAYLLLECDPVVDGYDAHAAHSALKQAETVIALTSFATPTLLEDADVLLPVSPFSETAGSFVNMEGRLQTFNGVVRPLGETRPAWKVLRVLGNRLDLPGFEQESVEQVRAEWLAQGSLSEALDNSHEALAAAPAARGGLVRIGEIPLYQSDMLCRHAPSLQATRAGAVPVAYASSAVLSAAGVESGAQVTLVQGGATLSLRIEVDDSLPGASVHLAAHPLTALAGLFDPIEIRQG